MTPLDQLRAVVRVRLENAERTLAVRKAALDAMSVDDVDLLAAAVEHDRALARYAGWHMALRETNEETITCAITNLRRSVRIAREFLTEASAEDVGWASFFDITPRASQITHRKIWVDCLDLALDEAIKIEAASKAGES